MRNRFLRTRKAAAASGYDADVQAWIDARAALSDPVPPAYADAVNPYILSLKAISGMWATITQLNIYAAATTVAGGLCAIKGPNQTHNNLSAGDFALRTGVLGNTTDKSIDTGYLSSSLAQNNIHTYALVTAAASGSSRAIFGHSGPTAGGLNIIWNTNSRCHAATVGTFTGSATGGYGVARGSSANFQRMVADSVATVTATSTAPSGSNRLMVLARTSSSNVIDSWFNGRILVWACGSNTDLANYTTPGNNLIAALNAI